ncbi:MAG: hypothetical protein SWI22_14345 [Pseudomonadota bacterium]|nr:hypothetical protein [Pseudomonadota bacterium]
MARRLATAAALGMAGALTACASSGPPPAAPLLQYERTDCAATPALTAAISLTPDKPKAAHIVETLIDARTPCLDRAGRPTPYLVYALPADTGDKTLIVGGQLEPNRIFSPEVAVLDARGEITRTFAAADFMYRGPVFSIQFRPRETEAYVLVTNEPSRVGQVYNSILTGTQSTPVPAGAMMFMVNSGTEARLARTFSYDGRVHILVNDSDVDEER